MDMAERKGELLRRLLRSADRLSDSAISRARRLVNTPFSSVKALLVRVTRADQRRDDRFMPIAFEVDVAIEVCSHRSCSAIGRCLIRVSAGVGIDGDAIRLARCESTGKRSRGACCRWAADAARR